MEKINNIQKFRAMDWFAFDGDNTLRLDYNLNQDSVVFDVGGYLGLSSQKIWDKFKCNIYIFEPVKEFADKIAILFKDNPKVHVFNFGLSNRDYQEEISVVDDKSSLYKASGEKIKINLKSISKFILENNIEKIDLMEINIEGGEYDLLQDLIDSNQIEIVENLQIQFHDFVENAELKMNNLRERLFKTHYPTFMYDFLWENWTRNIAIKTLEDYKSVSENLYNQIKLFWSKFSKLNNQNVKLKATLESKDNEIGLLNSKLLDNLKEIEFLKTEVNTYKFSRSYKVGRILLSPIILLKNLLKK